jgi:hypothetical protein
MSDNDYSPFDAPVKEPNTLNQTSGGIKMEKITDAELDGKKGGGGDIPGDAPTFEIPKFDEIPNADLGTGDPFAPGSSSGGFGVGGNKSGSGGGNGGGGNDGGTKIDNGFAKEFSEYTAKWLVDLFFRLLVKAFVSYAKIDRAEVVKAINDGDIDAEFLRYIDQANDEVEKKIYVSEDEKKFVIEPLKYFLEVKKVQLKPEWMFGLGVVMVAGSLGIRAFELKKTNKEILDQVIKESNKRREEDRERRERERKSNPYERQESFYNPGTSNVEKEPAVNFTNPSSGGVEIVEVEEVYNDDNAS